MLRVMTLQDNKFSVSIKLFSQSTHAWDFFAISPQTSSRKNEPDVKNPRRSKLNVEKSAVVETFLHLHP